MAVSKKKKKIAFSGKPVAPKGPVAPGIPATSTIGSPAAMGSKGKCPMCSGGGKAQGKKCLMCEGSGNC